MPRQLCFLACSISTNEADMMFVDCFTVCVEKMLTRDSRRVERKKPGQPKARKKRQWVKR